MQGKDCFDHSHPEMIRHKQTPRAHGLPLSLSGYSSLLKMAGFDAPISGWFWAPADNLAAVALVGSVVENPFVAVADTALPDRAHCAKLDGISNCRTAVATSRT